MFQAFLLHDEFQSVQTDCEVNMKSDTETNGNVGKVQNTDSKGSYVEMRNFCGKWFTVSAVSCIVHQVEVIQGRCCRMCRLLGVVVSTALCC